MSYSARRPYLKLKLSATDFYTEPVRFLNPGTKPESEFEKPYSAEDYRSMHFDLPEPDWPTGTGGDSGITPKGKFGFRQRETKPPGDDCTTCYLVAHPGHSDFCGEELWAADIHSTEYCTNYPFIGADCKLTLKIIEGEIIGELPGLFGWPISRYILFNPNIENHVVLATMTDGGGNKCDVVLNQRCTPCNCNDPPEGPLTYDIDNSAETITAGTPVYIYITGGCPPFTWEVDGESDYSFNFSSSETEERVNQLNLYTATCGSATYRRDAAEITVTDSCGSTCTGICLNVAGAWSVLGGVSAGDCNTGTGCDAGLTYLPYIGLDDQIVVRLGYSCCDNIGSGGGGGPIGQRYEANYGYKIGSTFYQTGTIDITFYWADYGVDCPVCVDNVDLRWWQVPYCYMQHPDNPNLLYPKVTSLY